MRNQERNDSDAAASYILGAGFSKAVSIHMPITDELGADCVSRDPEVLGKAVGPTGEARPNFEVWLSRRAEDQPYRSSAENLSARAIFAGAVPLIAASLNERQSRVLSEPAPAWLQRLVYLWHTEKTPVITFNYDCLVECAVDTYKLPSWEDHGRMPWASVLRFVPAASKPESIGEMEGRAPWETFQLHKLHGSLNWFWTSGDTSGATIQRGRLPGMYAAPNPMTESERSWRHPGRETFIVPPSALKSSYYGNPVTREIWSSAHAALRRSSKVVLMGYSLPLTDLSTAGLIASALELGGASSVDIVDRNPEAVRQNLQQMIDVPDGAIRLFGGEQAIPEYVESVWQDSRKTVVQEMAALASSGSARGLLVYWDGLEVAAAIGAGSNGNVLTIDIDSPGNQWEVTAVDRSCDGPSAKGQAPLISLPQLGRFLSTAESIQVRVPDGRISPVLDAEFIDMTAGKRGHGVWLVLKCPALGLPGAHAGTS